MQKTKRRLSALSAAVLLIVALACGGVVAWAVGGWPDGEPSDNKLTVSAAEDEGFAADLDGQLVVDMYQIAAATPDSNYVKYNYQSVGGVFSGLDFGEESLRDAAFWEALAQDAAKCVTTGMATANSGGQLVATGIPDGLYLLIPHGADVTPAYGASIADSLKAHGKGGQYDYAFSPSIVAVPNAQSESGESITSGEWTRDVQVTLKPSRLPRYGSLTIIKHVQNSGNYAVQPTSFAFHITGILPDGSAYGPNGQGDYVSIYYDGGQLEPKVVGGIPAGTKVTVTEEPLNEASWRPVDGTEQQAVIVADTQTEIGVATVEFTNEYVPTSGFAVENTFELQKIGDGEDDWDWTWIQVDPDSAKVEAPTE